MLSQKQTNGQMMASLLGPITVSRVVIWCLITWSSFFVIIVVPIALVYHSRISTHEVVTAKLSNYRIEKRKGKRGNLYDATLATIAFDRAEGTSCKLDDQVMRYVDVVKYRPDSIEIAVHPQSCYEFLRTPFPNIWRQLLGIFSAGLLFICIITATFAMQGLEENKTSWPTA